MLVEAIVFDMDDTLFPEVEYNLSGLRAVSDLLYRDYSIDNAYDLLEMEYFNGDRSHIFDNVLRTLSLSDHNDFIVSKLVDEYRAHNPDIRLYSDASEV